MSTTTSDAEINEALAKVQGWTSSGGKTVWRVPGKETRLSLRCPDYLSDPVASAELEDWLYSRGILIDVFQQDGLMRVTLHLPDDDDPVGVVRQGMTSAARRRALALAAFAALCGSEGR